jgi:hypothetical protein
MGEDHLQSFQKQVSNLLIRHRSFLDVTSKITESGARVNRALMKSVTECGCIEVSGKKQNFPGDLRDERSLECLRTHLSGRLCDHCRDIVQTELGKNLFYLAALCNLLDFSLVEVLERESSKLSTLGVFTLR